MTLTQTMFSNRDLRKLLIPLIIEQVLTSFMGTIDTMMVSNIGSTAVSGVSCVDSINKLVIFLFTSISTGGCIICSQFLGRGEKKGAGETARQVLLVSGGISLLLMGFCLAFRGFLLHLIFGTVEEAVMTAALDYFLITVFSYPFTAVFNSCAAIYRAAGNSRLPMVISASCNILNIIGNYVLLFLVKMGVAGAAVSTTVSMAIACIVIMIRIRREQAIEIGSFLSIRPDLRIIGRILKIGIPTGVENSMFQFGKLVVQSTVATLGTMAIASNAIVTSLELISSMPSQAVGIGLVTVAGQCIGAGKIGEAKYYIRKLTIWAALLLAASDWIIYAVTYPVCLLAGFDTPTMELTMQVMLVISIVKPVLWPLAFVPSNGMRAAGDVNFTMITAVISMWVFRVGLTTVLCRVLGIGLIGIWCGYFLDWLVRSIVIYVRYRSGKWTRFSVLD
ncbi:MAG: MATE family efflux transporter [Parasporobacterium sp.]|nr:MATE family efflux transporter [Parasporobacterium sp.]